MELEALIELVNKNHRDEGCIGFPRLVESLPDRLEQQKSDIEGIEVEWIWQTVDQFDCYQGELAYQLNDGRYLIFDFCG